MGLSANQVADYLRRYIAAYRQQYRNLTAPPPQGGGYPLLEISPYVGGGHLFCFLSGNGTATVHLGNEPKYQWWIAGGPALMADFPDTRTPPEMIERLKREGLWGKDIGIYRLVAKNGIPDEIWQGIIGPITQEATAYIDNVTISVQQLELSHIEVIQRLTFGSLGLILDIPPRMPDSDFWEPIIIRGLGFLTADRHYRRFLSYLELSPHTDTAAWDVRSIRARVRTDVRRDFGWAFSQQHPGGTISFSGEPPWIAPYYDRLALLSKTIACFRDLLDQEGDKDEGVFHAFLRENSILLDVYGSPVSKPRFVYPKGDAPLGKKYVEPDFVIKYPGQKYKLVELERPSKLMATKEGQPRAEVNQAGFQLAEWKAYIAKHYDRIKDVFPGIALAHEAMIVISRSSAASYGGGQDIAKYKELLRAQYPGIDILTYDDLLERAEQAYIRLSSLGIERSAPQPGA